MPSIFDYSRAFYFAPASSVNRLAIAVKSRANMNWPSGKVREYWLAATHPRENTFQDDGHIYDQMLALEQGASFITFMFDQVAGESIIDRRYDYPGQPEVYKHQIGPVYEGPLVSPPQLIPSASLRELLNLDDIIAAASAADPIFAVIEYSLSGGPAVRVETPINVMNINPLTRTGVVARGKQWQAASGEAPVYVQTAGNDDLSRTRVGYVAFSDVGSSVRVSIVYNGNVSTPRASQDFSLTVNYDCAVKLYARAAT